LTLGPSPGRSHVKEDGPSDRRRLVRTRGARQRTRARYQPPYL